MEKDKINFTKKKRNRQGNNNENPPHFTFCQNLALDSFMDLGTDNTFVVFNSLDNIFYLIYSNQNKSIISYDIVNNKKKIKIKNAHKQYITGFEHHLDIQNNKKRDLILSMSAKENNIKIWIASNFECILELKRNNKNKLLNLACFLSFNNKTYIVRSGNNTEPIKVYDLNNNNDPNLPIKEIQNINNSEYNTHFLYVHYKNLNNKDNNNNYKSINKNDIKNDKKNKNGKDDNNNININEIYILAINDKIIRSYDYNSNSLYNTYYSKTKQRINNISFNGDNLIGLCYGGIIQIWNFSNPELTNEINICKSPLFGICLWDEDYLCFGHLKNIKIINLDNKKVFSLDSSHNKDVICIKKINHPIFGECLISQGDQNGVIKLWRKQN